MDVGARTLKSLEWDRLKNYLADECSGSCSRQRAMNLEPLDDPGAITFRLQESEQAARLLDEGVDLAQENLPDIQEQLLRLSAGAALAARELSQIKTVMTASARLKSLLVNLDKEQFAALRKNSVCLSVFSELVRSIESVVDDEGEVKDEASPLLLRLRREVQRLNAHIKDELLRIINSSVYSKCLQEPIYTIRNGRHVLPVLANMRHSMEGIVHDSSASGLTVYVEPKSVVELTNTIRIRESEIEREIERLLRELSGLAAGRLDDLADSFAMLVDTDFLAARTRVARKYRGTLPSLAAEPEIRFLQARHPLLVLQSGKLDAVVANDIVLGKELRTLIITGPNTGGKTVYLKTAGLLSLMLRAGLLLPVAEGSRASIFTGIFADIGDEQSLEQNLSTFSSHMSNIIELSEKAAPASLVLLDEIGAGTDPREGVILARVILKHLTAKGAFTLCSTHYGELKTLAHSHSCYANASLEFDDTTLTPSYRLRPGLAGNSHAIVVAARLGLPADLVSEAQESLASSKHDFEHMIDQVENRLRMLSRREEEFAEKEAALLKLEAEFKEKDRALQGELKRSRQEASGLFESEYRRAKKFINELTANLQKTPSLPKAQQAKEKLEAIKKDLAWLDSEEYARLNENITPGQTVKVRSLAQVGVVEELTEPNSAQVRVGRIRIKVLLQDLEVCPSQSAAEKPVKSRLPAARAGKAGFGTVSGDPVFVRSSRNTLDLRGERVDEGLALLARFVDEAYLERLSPVMIIHGHGTGAMKAAVRDYLRNCDYKNKSRPGEPYEGGDGVTVVNFA
jgi:DNA mismatch repair protein MutS2